MWINREVNLPDDLIAAQQDGKLVVFAGAGISMGAPSNLPSFEALAIDLAGGGIAVEPHEPLDRFLGRVEARGTNIQTRARAILGNPLSQAREIHRALCRLFSSTAHIRLITTNFDRHFTTTLRQECGEALPIYYAPALPLGHDFAGLVYLHGAIEHQSHRLVLSDADFGRAYLTEGWATRFLYEVFRTYTVLFVGYSHRDPVIRYIARGLSPGGLSRFALVSSEDDSQWQYFGVTAIPYPLREPPERHAALDGAINDWVTRCRMGVFDHEHRIRQLATLPPPVAEDESDYVEAACRNATTLRFFVAVARGREWLEWIAKRGFLQRLFRPESELDECGRLFASWLTQSYAIELPQPLFDLIQEKGGQLTRDLWFEMTRTIALANPRPVQGLLEQWLVVLLQSARAGWAHNFLEEMLKGCREAPDGTAALLLWHHLAAPHAKLVRPWRIEESDESAARIRVELYTIGDKSTLRQCWREYLGKNLEQMHPQLAPMLTSMLHEAHLLMRATGEGGDGWDGTSLMRSAIEPHEQDRFPHDIDILVDAARDLVEWLLINHHPCAVGLRHQWLESSTPLVRRLGIHALTLDPKVEADEAVRLIVARGWLYDLRAKHEVFKLLKTRYALASEGVRQEVLAASLADVERGEAEDSRGIGAYEQFNLALWLHEAAPGCAFTTALFQRLQAENPNFTRREYPDLSSWGTEATRVVPQSPITVEELLSKTPTDAAPWLATYKGRRQDFEGPDRDGLLTVVREAASRDWGWTERVMVALRTENIWVEDLWGALLNGIGAAEHSREEWEAIIALLERMPELTRKSAHGLLDLLEKLAQEDVASMTPELVLRTMRIASRTLDEGEHPDTVIPANRKDWLTLAINHVGGKAAMVAIQGLGKLRHLAGETWGEMPAEVKEWLEGICRDDRVDAQRARTVLASNFHFFFGLEREWATRVLLPLFDWQRDPSSAEQAWYGYLAWGKWNDAILEALQPSLETSFARITADLAELRDGLATRLAAMALYAATDPWHGGWLMKFVRDTDNQGLRSWAWAMGHALRDLKPDAVEAVWSGWMRDYWAARVTGVPRPFAEEELGAMLEWIPGLLPVLPEVVELLTRQPVHLPEHSVFFYTLRDSPAVATHPVHVARLLAHLLTHASGLAYECGFVTEVARKLNAEGAERDVLTNIVESLARLGCSEASQLRSDLGV